MYKSFIVITIILSFSVNVMADYLSGRKAADKLGRSGKHQEALIAFSNLVGEAKSDFQKSDALEQAVYWASVLKQYDQAMAFAKQIPLAAASKNCRMKILRGTRKNKELIAEFKDEKIDDWPESLVGDGLFSRGSAYYTLKDGPAAEADLKKAVDYITEAKKKASAMITLGNNYHNNLKDDPKALEAYNRVIAMKLGNYHTRLSAVISAARILRKQGKYDEALKTLGNVDIGKMKGVWLGSMLCAYGETYEAQGKKAEAIAKFKEAAALKGLPASHKALYEKKLKALQSDAK